ncbi:MAG TPA: right-handed parallel beta-helix repeat-containing protein [Candidatus Kapabacteria bacterium]|nr:right-handed parallel beta-helix repeat-containing protein [Candidatus Kapabacteria bacterium]
MTKLRIALLMLFPVLIPFAGWAQVQVGPGQMYPDIGAAANARAVHPGDTVFVHAGTYTDANTLIDSLIGTPDHWITIMPYGQDSVSIHVQYTFQAAQYLKISGLNFFGNDPAQSARVYHLLFFDYQYACFTSNHDIIIENCAFAELNNTGKQNTGACLKIDGTENFQVLNCAFLDGTNITDGISLNADRNGTVRHCTFENMPGDGSHCKGGAKNITYEQNLFRNCAADGLDVGGETDTQYFCPLGATWEADSIKVYANIFIGGATGIRLSSCHHAFIFNNTCFKATEFAFRSLNTSSMGITLDSNYIYNNIFTTYSPYHIYLNASSNFIFSTEYFKNNLFHDYLNPDPDSINWSELPGVNVSGSLIGDPDFLDTLNGNFSLTAGSPAIGAGFPTPEPATDYMGAPYSLTARSIGAYESSSAEVTATAVADEFIISPNPCKNFLTLFCKGNTTPFEIIILDILGREVRHITVSPRSDAEPIRVDAAALLDGEYMLLARASNGVLLARRSFVKLR